MNNILKGWITSIIGLCIIIGSMIHLSGFYQFPVPEGWTEVKALSISFVTGLILFLVPATKLETYLEKILGKKVDKS